MNNEGKALRLATNLSAIVALTLSLVNLGTLFWKGGAFVTEFRQLQREVLEIKAVGSPLYKMHEDRDNERAKNFDMHFKSLDEIVKLVPTLDKKLSIIDLKIDNLSANLEEHKKATIR